MLFGKRDRSSRGIQIDVETHLGVNDVPYAEGLEVEELREDSITYLSFRGQLSDLLGYLYDLEELLEAWQFIISEDWGNEKFFSLGIFETCQIDNLFPFKSLRKTGNISQEENPIYFWRFSAKTEEVKQYFKRLQKEKSANFPQMYFEELRNLFYRFKLAVQVFMLSLDQQIVLKFTIPDGLFDLYYPGIENRGYTQNAAGMLEIELRGTYVIFQNYLDDLKEEVSIAEYLIDSAFAHLDFLEMILKAGKEESGFLMARMPFPELIFPDELCVGIYHKLPFFNFWPDSLRRGSPIWQEEGIAFPYFVSLDDLKEHIYAKRNDYQLLEGQTLRLRELTGNFFKALEASKNEL